MRQDDNLLRNLAIIMVERPRSTLKELAEAVGVSRATLHRMFGTRDHIVEKINEYGVQVLSQIARTISAQAAEKKAISVHSLINMHLEHREVLVYQMFQYKPDTCSIEEDTWQLYNNTLDNFFLNGQQSGVFRIDIKAAALTEYFVSLIYGTVDAERRGRLANAESTKLLESFFLKGSGNI